MELSASNQSKSRGTKSTAARVGPRQAGPPVTIIPQREFVLQVLRKAGDQGISKNAFRDGSNPLLGGRRVVEIAGRICELEEQGYIFEHVKGIDRLVTYVLRSEPMEPIQPAKVDTYSPKPPQWPKPPQAVPQQAAMFQTFLQFETGVRR